jgi:hypothetical protein
VDVELRWQATDGTRLHYEPGTFETCEVDDLARCHFCGFWWRSVGGHSRHEHGLTADRYRDLTGLLRSQPLVAPGLSRKYAADLRRRQETDKRIQAGMRLGHELARAGELSDRAVLALDAHGRPRARKDQLRRGGRQLGTRRAQKFLAAREARAKALGYVSLENYLWSRYYREDGRIEDLMADLGRGWSTVRGDLDRLGIPVRPRGRRRRK